MRIALVSTYSRPFAIGLRYISSSLKAAGHDVTMLFLSPSHRPDRADWNADLLEDLVGRLRGCGLVGVSLMTNSFLAASSLTDRLREAGLTSPVVWGGVHPTLQPDECLRHADAVCVGEGEQPMLDLAERLECGDDPTPVAGLSFRPGSLFGNERTVRNPPGPLRENLDELPLPDYELETQWVADGDHFAPADARGLRGVLHRFTLLTSRGCPYACAFCNNSGLRAAHGAKGKWVRLRNLDRVLEEMRCAVACFPTIHEMHIVDDLFFLQPAEAIERFVAAYTAEINLPLLFQVSPLTVSERKVQAIARAPLKVVIMGIQSASRDTLYDIFTRRTPPDRIAAAIDILAKHRIPAEYHYIVNNPYESERNVLETIRFIASHHRPAKIIRTFPLMFFPGTPLAERAEKDGLIDGRHDLAYEHRSSHASRIIRRDYLTGLMRLVLGLRNVGLPSGLVHRIIDLAIHPWARKVFGSACVAIPAFAVYRITRRIVRDGIIQPAARLVRLLRRSKSKTARRSPPTKWPVPNRPPRQQARCGTNGSRDSTQAPPLLPGVADDGEPPAPSPVTR